VLVASLLIGLSPASAKDAIDKLRLCGASGCIVVRNMTRLQILMTYITPGTSRQPALAAYFTFAPVPTRSWPSSYPRYVYVPSVKVVRINYPPGTTTWGKVGEAAPVLRRLTRGLRPYLPPRSWSAVNVTARARSSP
jgi:hypothetical protein